MSDTTAWTAPDRIYLQPHMWPEVTWCGDRIEQSDVEYLRANLAESRLAAVTAERDRLRELADEIGAELSCLHVEARDNPAMTMEQVVERTDSICSLYERTFLALAADRGTRALAAEEARRD